MAPDSADTSADTAPALPPELADADYPLLSASTARFTAGAPRRFTPLDDGSVLFLRSDGPTSTVGVLRRLQPDGSEAVLVDPSALDTPIDLPPAERARRERLRESGAGIVSYTVTEDEKLVVFAIAGQPFAYDVDADALITIDADDIAGVVDPRPSADGTHIGWVRDRSFEIVTRRDDGSYGNHRELARASRNGQTVGLADFIAAEELGRLRGWWFSPDGSHVALAFVDERDVETWHIADPANPAAAPRPVAYPAAGTTNATVRLEIRSTHDGATQRIDWNRIAFEYLVDVRWTKDRPLTLVVMSRDQRDVRMLAVDKVTAQISEVMRLSDDDWVELTGSDWRWHNKQVVHVRDDRDTDCRRLYIADTPLSPPSVNVRQLVSIVEDTAVIVVSQSGRADRMQLAKLDLSANAEMTLLSPDHGLTSAAVGDSTSVVQRRRPDAARTTTYVVPTGTLLAGSYTDDSELEKAAHVTSAAAVAPVTPAPTQLQVTDHKLAATLVLPENHDGQQLPVILDPYGGPHAQRSLDYAGAHLTSQWLANQGFAVLVVDGRGTPGRGPAFERAVKGDLATGVLADQLAALDAVAEDHQYLDLERVGIRGWSFGGFLAGLAALKRPDRIRAAVLGAPVTDWRLYDTAYTERYLDHPTKEADAYRVSSLIDDDGLVYAPEGNAAPARMLLIHGLADDNVFAAHTLRLSAALHGRGLDHALLPLTGVTHMTPQVVVAANLLRREVTFFTDALLSQ